MTVTVLRSDLSRWVFFVYIAHLAVKVAASGTSQWTSRNKKTMKSHTIPRSVVPWLRQWRCARIYRNGMRSLRKVRKQAVDRADRW